jgi:ATP-dependent DNA helicase RecQ
VEAPAPPVDEALYESLRQARAAIADKVGLPPYIIFHDNVLRDMASNHPKSLLEMGAIIGIGERKLAAYGLNFLAVILDHDAVSIQS